MISRIAFACCVVAAVSGFSGRAHANRLKVESYKFDAGNGIVELTSKSEIGEPWMRFDHGEVRIWFPDIEDITRFDHNDSERVIHSVRLRYGSDNTAVLKVDLSDRRTLRRDDIEVLRNGPRATITIHTTREEIQPQPPAAAPIAVNAQKDASRPIVTKLPIPVPAQAPGYKQPLPGAAQAPSAVASTQKPRSALNFSPTNGGLASGMGALLLTALALGVIYGFIKFGTRRNVPIGQHRQIEVIGTKRIGPRHQLVLVRALGQDHLLSLHGGRAECLSSVPSATTPADPALEPPSGGRGLGLFAPFLSRRKPWENVLDEGINTPSPKAKSDAPPFGDELLDFVRSQQNRRNSSTSIAAAAPGVTTNISSEAVAGIARLRARAMS